MENVFNDYNTEGYSKTQIQALNNEWFAIVETEKLDYLSDDYYAKLNWFDDEVNRRQSA